MEEKDKEIHCSCNKLLLKITPSGTIKVWCKKCHKEIEIEIKNLETE